MGEADGDASEPASRAHVCTQEHADAGGQQERENERAWLTGAGLECVREPENRPDTTACAPAKKRTNNYLSVVDVPPSLSPTRLRHQPRRTSDRQGDAPNPRTLRTLPA